MVAVGKFSMKQVQDAWRGRSALRGYHFGFNLKTLRPDEASLRDWFVEAQKAGVTGRKDIEATAYVTPLHAYVARNAAEFRVARGIQEIHWASPGSHTSEPETYDLSQDYFRFMFAPDVEPTNNHSEQQIRHCVIDRKITQGTRSEKGQRYHERMWTAIATCRKQNRNFFSFLHKSIRAKRQNQPAPSLLNVTP